MSRELAQQEAELLTEEPLYVKVASDPALTGVRFCEDPAPASAPAR